MIDWVARCGARARPAADGAPGQGRLLGHRGEARAGARARRLSGVHPQGDDRPLLPGLRRASCSPRGRVSIRNSPPTTRSPSRASSRRRAASRATNSSACTAWARRSTRRCSREMPGVACRVYAPVGGHRDLLAYLVRRLLENGANSSFVSVAGRSDGAGRRRSCERPQRLDRRRRPTRAIRAFRCRAISMRRRGAIRRASSSATRASLEALLAGGRARRAARSSARRSIDGSRAARRRARRCARRSTATTVGSVAEARRRDRATAMAAARSGLRRLERDAGRRRAPRRSSAPPICSRQSAARLIALLQREGGKTLDDALAEVREAVDFCRYYAAQARAPLAPRAHAGPDRRDQRAAPSRARRLRLHQPVEFSARDLPRPGRGGARRRQCRGRQARRADAADRRRARCGCCTRPACRRRALHLVPGDGKVGAALVARSARRRRRLHRLDRGRAADQPRARRQGRADRAADRRDRRHQRHDRRRDRAARAGDRRRHHLGVPLRRPALLGAAAALRAGGCRRPHARDDRGRGARARRSAIRATSRPMSAR